MSPGKSQGAISSYYFLFLSLRVEAEAEGRRLEALQANQQLLLQQAYLGNANN